MHATPPDRGLFSTVPFRAFWLRADRGRGTGISGFGDLVALIVTFLIIAVFLLLFFSASGEVIVCSDTRLDGLAVARHCEPIGDPGPVIWVAAGQVIVEGVPVGRVHDLAESPEPFIGDLAEILRNLGRNSYLLEPERKGLPGIYIEAKRDTPFAVLRKIMRTAAAEGYTRIELVVTCG